MSDACVETSMYLSCWTFISILFSNVGPSGIAFILPWYIPFIDYIVASKIRLLLHFVYLLDAFCIRLLARSYACVEIFQSLVAFPSNYKIDRCLFNKMNSLCWIILKMNVFSIILKIFISRLRWQDVPIYTWFMLLIILSLLISNDIEW